MRYLLLLLFLLPLPAVDVATPAITASVLDAQHSDLAIVLKSVVKTDGVDYAALQRNTSALDRYRVQLARTTTPSDAHEKIAFYINAYNAFTLALVAEQLPKDTSAWNRWSIKDAGGWFTSVWKYYTFELAGTRVTLDQLEHAMLRPLGEPRIHFAINCASRSCPSLAATPYLATTLEQQLEVAAKSFASNPYHLRLVDGSIITNPILSWFAADFSKGGGVATFLASRVSPSPLAQKLTAGATLTYFTYDWSLNLATTP